MKKELIIPDEIKQDIIQYLSGNLTKTEAHQLMNWLDISDEHKVFFDTLTDIWHSSATFISNNTFDPNDAWNEVKNIIEETQSANNKPTTLVARFIRNYYKVAAFLVLALSLGYYAFYTNFTQKMEVVENQFVEMVAPRGSRSVMTLPDGSRVWLNSGSRIRFANKFGIATRDIQLEGEAYFMVAKNKNVPFIVNASKVRVTAIGTAFNVKAYPGEEKVETTLEEGSVKVEALYKNNQIVKSLILKPKEKALFLLGRDKQNTEPELQGKPTKFKRSESIVPLELTMIPVDDIKPITSWKESRWIFRNETMADLALKLERRYDVEIRFMDPLLRNYSFNGNLQDESIVQVLEAIRLVAPIDFKIAGKVVKIQFNKQLKDQYEKLLVQ